MAKNNECFEIGLAAGIIGGLIAGMIFAPDEGKKSREKILKAVENFQEEHDDEIEDAKRNISKAFDYLAYNVECKFRKLVNRIRARRLRRAKELEDEYMYN